MVPVENSAQRTQFADTVMARLRRRQRREDRLAAPGNDRRCALEPAEFPQLHLAAPRLWWPNGYGDPNLYTLQIQVETGRSVSDSDARVRFGIRQLTYELSLFDHDGRLRRVEVDPTLGSDPRRAPHRRAA